MSPNTAPQRPPAVGDAEPVLDLEPPDERLWQKYSPRGEFPISGLLSVTLHVVVVVGVLAVVFNWLGLFTNDTKPIPTEMVEVGTELGPKDAGGGLTATGDGKPKDDVEPTVAKEPEYSKLPPDQDIKPMPKIDDLPPDLRTDPLGQALLEAPTKASDKFFQMSEENRKALLGGTGPSGTKGNTTGPGSGNTPGGVGKDTAKRVLRWTMSFNTSDGQDYVKQLRAMQAILAFPRADGKVDVIHDLHNPRAITTEPLKAFRKMFWQDTDGGSMAGLQMALGLRGRPGYVIAFFPEELEKLLLKKELEYKGLREDQIHQTFFDIKVYGNDKYDVFVRQQDRAR